MAQKKASAARASRKSAKAAGAPPPAPLESLVVYVHGVGRHAPPDELKLEWDLALFGRDLGPRSRMAYWADLVHPPEAAPRKKAADRRTLTLDDVLDDAGVPARRQAPARDFALNVLDELGLQEQVSEQGPRKKVLPLPAWMRKPMSRAFLEAFIGDTAAYFFNEGLRRRIRDRLLEQLKVPADQPVTIVAHSQGSVIAYEVLWTLKRGQVDLDALVTLGSPLGIRELQDFLDPPPKVPPAVRRWHNFADPLDPVAADKALSSDFRSDDMTVQDELVMNSQSRRFWGFNPHSAVGYLAHPGVRRAVNDAMRMDVMSRFVIARDVAERLGSPGEERHPVLIEVLEPGYRALDESEGEMVAVEAREREALSRDGRPDATPLKLEHRIAGAAQALRRIVADEDAARIDELRRFVAARLTSAELRAVGASHKELRVYAVWQSARKAKLTHRSMRALKCDAALTSFAADGRGITWAVLDTGIHGGHKHFDGVISAVWDCTKRGRPVKVEIEKARDPDGHGTHVAGIIAGQAPPAGPGQTQRHERGAAPHAKLVIYKVLDDKGQGEDAWIIKALDHIAEQNDNVTDGLAIHGLNLSLGGPFDNTVYGCGFSPICAELRRLWRAGVLVVVACGNEGLLQVTTPDGETEINSSMSIGDPANLDDCIAVGSVNADRPNLYGVSSFSSRGPTADGRVKPDVVAPGERISSCNARFRSAKDMYYMESGTSMAAPHVSGLLAAFLSVRREFRGRPDEVKQVLLKSCTDIGRDRYHQGHGVPNLMQMLLLV
jgi:hypothetical protein